MKNYKIYRFLFLLAALQIRFQNLIEQPELSEDEYVYEGYSAELMDQWLMELEALLQELKEMEEQSVELEENLNTTIDEILRSGNTSLWLMVADSLQIQLGILQTEIRDAINNLKGTSTGRSQRHLRKKLLKDQVISTYPRRSNSCPDVPAEVEESGSLTKSMSKNGSLNFKDSFKMTLSEISKKMHIKKKQLHKCLHKLPEPWDQRPSTSILPHSGSEFSDSSDTSKRVQKTKKRAEMGTKGKRGSQVSAEEEGEVRFEFEGHGRRLSEGHSERYSGRGRRWEGEGKGLRERRRWEE